METDRQTDRERDRARERESESKSKIESDGVDTVDVKMSWRRRSVKKSGRSRRTKQRNRPSLSRPLRSLCLCLTVAFSLCHVLSIRITSPDDDHPFIVLPETKFSVYCMHMRIEVFACNTSNDCNIGRNSTPAAVTNNHNIQVVIPITRMP